MNFVYHLYLFIYLFAAIESFSKLGDSIYFEEKGDTPGLYIIQYIANSFNWKSGGVTLHQKIESVSSMDAALQVSLAISSNEVLFSRNF